MPTHSERALREYENRLMRSFPVTTYGHKPQATIRQALRGRTTEARAEALYDLLIDLGVIREGDDK